MLTINREKPTTEKNGIIPSKRELSQEASASLQIASGKMKTNEKRVLSERKGSHLDAKSPSV
jgi:hypothetical protein